MSKTIEDLRTRLFDVIDAVKGGTLDVERAKVVSELARDVISTAKVEVDYLRVTGGGESRFIDTDPIDPMPEALPNGIVAITRHALK
jgi:transcriptional antiterminator Rof (Rho-off)